MSYLIGARVAELSSFLLVPFHVEQEEAMYSQFLFTVFAMLYCYAIFYAYFLHTRVSRLCRRRNSRSKVAPEKKGSRTISVKIPALQLQAESCETRIVKKGAATRARQGHSCSRKWREGKREREREREREEIIIINYVIDYNYFIINRPC